VEDEREDRAVRLERQLLAAQKILHIGSWEWDLPTNEVTWSDELYRIYGLQPQSRDITLEVFMSFVHPKDRERVKYEVERALASGSSFSYPERIIRADGAVRHLDTAGVVARCADGRTRRLIGTCRDVTEERERDETIRLYASIGERVQIGLFAFRVADAAASKQTATLIGFNPEAEAICHRHLHEYLRCDITEIFPALVGTELATLLAQVAQGGEGEQLRRYSFPPGDDRVFSVKAFNLPGHCVGLALEDVTREARAQALKTAEQRVLEMIARGDPLGGVLTALIEAIEEQAPGLLGSVLLVQDGVLHHAAAPHLPDAYIAAVDGLPIGPRVGSCGTAAFRGEPVYVIDIALDPLWENFRELEREHGLRACWSTPIFAGDGRVAATFALYYRAPRGPTEQDLQLIDRATHVARIAIERNQLVDQLRALSAHIDSVREDERKEIAREIHDQLGQALTALKIDLAWVDRHADGMAVADLRKRVGEMSSITDDLIGRVRRISAALRPGVLDDLGLHAAIEWQAQEFERRTGTRCVVRSNMDDVRVDARVTTAVFRVFQEALTNVSLHANAGHVEIRLERRNEHVLLEVRDDGVGIPPEAEHHPASLGLLGMRERVLRLGGTVALSRPQDGGTVVSVEIPLMDGP